MRRLTSRIIAAVLAAGGLLVARRAPDRWRLRLWCAILLAVAIIWLAGWASSRYVVRADPVAARRVMTAAGWGLLILSVLAALLVFPWA
jgi:hypothetical protein